MITDLIEIDNDIIENLPFSIYSIDLTRNICTPLNRKGSTLFNKILKSEKSEYSLKLVSDHLEGLNGSLCRISEHNIITEKCILKYKNGNKHYNYINAILKNLGNSILLIIEQSLSHNFYSHSNTNSIHEKLVGDSVAIRHIKETINNISQYNTNILINGETGTGKELVAKAIHDNSLRKDGPFVPVNCSALTSTLLESELFGHTKGSFTGAIRDRKGRFELAHGGTLFLDEVGTLTQSVQVKILRALQERTIERVGDSQPISIDIRIISATNRSLEELVKQEHFRQDLYYRLKVIQLDLPPLRERKSDIPLLINHFIEKFNFFNKKNILGFAPSALEYMNRYTWPGNVRELENILEYAIVMSNQQIIEPEYLPPELRHMKENGSPPPPHPIDSSYEEERIKRVLSAYNYNVSRAANSLNIHRTTLWRKMREYGIERNTH